MATFETEVFPNKGGGVTILQKDWDSQEVTVILRGPQITLVAEELSRLAKEEEFSLQQEEEQ
jgi:hypothetical protein